MTSHRHVHDISAFRLEHFDRWYELWVQSVDSGWAGPLAEGAKRHAARIATSLARRLLEGAWHPPERTSSVVLTERTTRSAAREGAVVPVVRTTVPGEREADHVTT